MKLRERIREQSRQVAEHMRSQSEKPKRYQVLWDCPKCGNSHNWWWEDKFEAWDDGECDMVCDRCMEPSRCKGDGMGFYVPVEEKPGTLERRVAELDDLNTDLHNYVRQIEDKLSQLNEDKKVAFDAINTLAKRLADVETGEIFDNLSRRVTTAELAIANLEDGVKAETYRDRTRKPPSVIDLIHGERPPFHERFREGCGFNEETMPGETIASILRFVAVEVERMTERDMGGSFTVSNLKVGENLRALADEAASEGWREDDEDEGPGWDLTGFDEEGTP